LLVTENEIVIESNTPDGGKITHKYEYGDSSEFSELCLNAMADCLEAEGWNDVTSYSKHELMAYFYELDAEYENGNTVSHHGLFNRTHIPEKTFKAFIDTIHVVTNVYGFGEILNLDGFMSAIKSGEVKYCGVEFSDGGSIYHYRTTDLRINVGDIVIVPVGKDNEEKEAIIKTVDYCRWDDTPYPLEKTKQIIRKIDDRNGKTPLLRFSAKTPLLCSSEEDFIGYEEEA